VAVMVLEPAENQNSVDKTAKLWGVSYITRAHIPSPVNSCQTSIANPIRRNIVDPSDVLIIQEPTMSDPHPSEDGGILIFDFRDPVFISDIGVMDIASISRIKFVVNGEGNNRRYDFKGMGENSVQRILVSQHNVERMVLKLTGPGAVTELNFCPIC
jgi:hypothetical protein